MRDLEARDQDSRGAPQRAGLPWGSRSVTGPRGRACVFPQVWWRCRSAFLHPFLPALPRYAGAGFCRVSPGLGFRFRARGPGRSRPCRGGSRSATRGPGDPGTRVGAGDTDPTLLPGGRKGCHQVSTAASQPLPHSGDIGSKKGQGRSQFGGKRGELQMKWPGSGISGIPRALKSARGLGADRKSVV